MKSAHSQILIKKPTNDEKALFFCYSNFLNKIRFTRSRNRELDDLLKFVFVNIGITRKRNSCEFLLSCLCNNVLWSLKQKNEAYCSLFGLTINQLLLKMVFSLQLDFDPSLFLIENFSNNHKHLGYRYKY